MNALRRRLLATGSSSLLLAPWLGTGLLLPGRVIAADWNRPAFTARSPGEALRAYGANLPQESREIVIGAPEIAENGAKVDIEISSQLPETRSIALFADRNPMPLCAALDLSAGVLPWCRLQVKLAESTRLRAVVRTADGKAHVAFRDIKVTLGGCGG
ncbi:MAG: thiosulfate oxidation carrier protein SoxY [Betaproteobacteria bacterium]|nr:thiosulfate oxidation carrier protein SoxY [Betaproteobacteria bacterium]